MSPSKVPLAVLEIHVRRPPYCTTCNSTGWWADPYIERPVVCRRCGGRSAVVEYSMFISTSHGMKAVWVGWPTPDQAVVERLLSPGRALP